MLTLLFWQVARLYVSAYNKAMTTLGMSARRKLGGSFLGELAHKASIVRCERYPEMGLHCWQPRGKRGGCELCEAGDVPVYRSAVEVVMAANLACWNR